MPFINHCILVVVVRNICILEVRKGEVLKRNNRVVELVVAGNILGAVLETMKATDGLYSLLGMPECVSGIMKVHVVVVNRLAYVSGTMMVDLAVVVALIA